MGTTVRLTTFTIIDCASCGIQFGLTDEYIERRQKDHAGFRCPNGHSNVWLDENREETLARQLASSNARATHLGSQLKETRKSRDAHKGHHTRTKRRIAKGICPCCNRQFANLGSHMNQKHPDFVEAD